MRRLSVPSRPLVAVAVVACVAACSEKHEGANGKLNARDNVGGTPKVAPSSPVLGAAPDTTCPKEGNWRLCSVEDRLVHAGLVVEKRDALVHRDYLKVDGTAYQIGVKDNVVEVFVYPSSEARKRDTDLLDSATASPKGTKVIYGAPPTLVMSNNMAAIVLSLNDRTVERLALALGAGLPQPEKKD